MKKRKLIALWGGFCLVLIISALPFMAACAQQEPAPTTAPSPAPSPSPAAPEKVWELRYSAQDSPGMYHIDNSDALFVNRVEEVTKGRVKVTPYWGQTLSKAPDNWEAVKTSVADLSWVFLGYLPGMAPLTEVVNLPFVGFNERVITGITLWELFEKFPEIQAEYADNKVLLFFATDAYVPVTTKKQVKTIEDIKGLQLRSHAGPHVDGLKALGAVPIVMPAPDLYTSLEKGVLDGLISNPALALTFKLHEVVQYYTMVPVAPSYGVIPINWNTWNSLPPDIQEQIGSITGLEGSKWWSYGWGGPWEILKKLAERDGYPFIEYTPTAEEFSKWQEIGGKPFWDKWIADIEAKGLPGQEVFDEAISLQEKYKGYQYSRPAPALDALLK